MFPIKFKFKIKIHLRIVLHGWNSWKKLIYCSENVMMGTCDLRGKHIRILSSIVISSTGANSYKCHLSSMRIESSLIYWLMAVVRLNPSATSTSESKQMVRLKVEGMCSVLQKRCTFTQKSCQIIITQLRFGIRLPRNS